MAEAIKSDFPFIGHRNYVHGPSFFAAFHGLLATDDRAGASVVVRHLRINRRVTANGVMAKAWGDERLPAWGAAAAEMACVVDGVPAKAAFYERETTPILRRVESRERTFVGSPQEQGVLRCRFPIRGFASQAEMFQAVVEANKQAHLLAVAGDPHSDQVRFTFVYCLDYTCPPDTQLGEGSVAITGLGTRTGGGSTFSLTRVQYGAGTARFECRLCFATTDPRASCLAP